MTLHKVGVESATIHLSALSHNQYATMVLTPSHSPCPTETALRDICRMYDVSARGAKGIRRGWEEVAAADKRRAHIWRKAKSRQKGSLHQVGLQIYVRHPHRIWKLEPRVLPLPEGARRCIRVQSAITKGPRASASFLSALNIHAVKREPIVTRVVEAHLRGT